MMKFALAVPTMGLAALVIGTIAAPAQTIQTTPNGMSGYNYSCNGLSTGYTPWHGQLLP